MFIFFRDVFLAAVNTLHLYSNTFYRKVKCFFVFFSKTSINNFSVCGKNTIMMKIYFKGDDKYG